VTDVSALIVGLSSPSAVVRGKAREALVARGQPSVTTLIEALSDTTNQVRWEAAKALVCLRAPEAAPPLIIALGDERYGVRWLAGEAPISFGREALEPLLTALTQLFNVFWRAEGAHHVLRHLARDESNKFLVPVIEALEALEPELAVPMAAEAAQVVELALTVPFQLVRRPLSFLPALRILPAFACFGPGSSGHPEIERSVRMSRRDSVCTLPGVVDAATMPG
jgi:HEAT repeat protein